VLPFAHWLPTQLSGSSQVTPSHPLLQVHMEVPLPLSKHWPCPVHELGVQALASMSHLSPVYPGSQLHAAE
jgi:hypothetical protein